MTLALLLFLATFLVSYANGANDNFKGVATLYGSGTASFASSLRWANLTTLAGALAAVVLGHGLARAFGGNGLIPDEIVGSAPFLAAVGLSAAGTVLLATRLGIPISTTHALMGALTGAGLVAAASAFQFSLLGSRFLLPLLLSPLAALTITMLMHPMMILVRSSLGIARTSCACVGLVRPLSSPLPDGTATTSTLVPEFTIGTTEKCRTSEGRPLAGISGGGVLDGLHFASAGAVSFARGLNDAPKIAALALAGTTLPFHQAVFMTAGGMLLGGVLGTRRVAETMSHRITGMNNRQGFIANIVTALLVLSGTLASMPLSTTHVSCGALFGLGAVTGQARWRMINSIVASWFATLPMAALLAAAIFFILE